MKLYGKNPVIERLKVDPKSIKKIYLQERHTEEGYIRKKARQWGISVYSVPQSKIQKLARSLNNQGIVAEIDGFSYLPYDELLDSAKKKKDAILFFDGLTDPQNLGVIIRSLACLGRFGIVLPTHKSVDITEAVLRVACGADSYVSVSKVSNLSQAIAKAKAQGFWIAGTVVKDGEDVRGAKLIFPLGLVVGSEQKGIRDVIRKHLDLELTIPMTQSRLSLNVAQATTLFCYEIVKQKTRK